MKRLSRVPRWLRWAGLGAGLLLTCFAVLAVEVYRYARVHEAAPADAAVVLGAAVWNGRPSPVFEERIDHAIRLYENGTVRFLIFTGGQGTNDPFIESVVGSRWAVDHGVAEEDTFCETSSRTTWDNLVGARQIVDRYKLGRVLVVSDPYHLRRAVSMARDLGLDADPSPTPTSRFVRFDNQLEFWLRETYLYSLYLGQKPLVDISQWDRKMVVGSCGSFPEQRPVAGK